MNIVALQKVEWKILYSVFAVLGMICHIVPAQGQNVIEENPSGAVKLRRIWYKLGPGLADFTMGQSAAGLGDLNGDGADEFSVRVNGQEFIYLGGEVLSHEPARVLDSTGPFVQGPVIGDFFGTGEKLYGYPRSRSLPNGGAWYEWLFFYRQDDDSLLVLTEHVLETREQACNMTYTAADLDGDGADELIVGQSCYQPEVWIYRGGADFDLSEPTLKIIDSAGAEKRDIFELLVTDFDGDGYQDVVYRILSTRLDSTASGDLKFWWGNEGTPWTWTNEPDRSVLLIPGTPIPDLFFTNFIDYNGDGVMDLTGNLWWSDSSVFFLWQSGPDYDPRTRNYDSTDVDLVVEDAFGGGSLGYVADSLRRYHMLPLTGPPLQRRDLYGLSGGADGPNLTYDTWVAGGESPLMGGWSAGDINGDGWEDRVIYSSEYGGPGVGIALILAGGPYIPVDDPTVSVREEPIAGESGGLYLWPNPVAGDELHVAWEGNLRHKPVMMRVHDMGGRLIVEGKVDSWRGTALWRCAGVLAGVYMVSLYDESGNLLSAARIVKE